KDVAAVSHPAANRAGNVFIVGVTPASGPSSSATKALVSRLRKDARTAHHRHGVDVLVTGRTAINLDVSHKLGAALPGFVIFIAGLALVLLLLVFRSIAVPLSAVIGFLFTIAASLGAVVWIFQDGHLAGVLGIARAAPVLSFLPVLMIAILFGL